MIIEILRHTPKWVFGLFVSLLFLGWQQSRTRVVKKYVIFILPVGMTFLSYFGLESSFGASILTVGLWFLGLILTAYTTYIFLPNPGVFYRRQDASFDIPGSWLPLMLMMAIFFTKYSVGVLATINPELLGLSSVIYFCSIIYGGFSGVFIGRAFSVWSSIGYPKSAQPVQHNN
ncbi:MAG: hypothetical protein RL497_1631 [Pseudomonadota bacterium]|jgi:uncharacterized membrane protein YhaH (DUF805 family)